jgi:glutathione S-transferase
MSLRLYFHPLSSFCWKALIALYENGTPFTPVSVDLSSETERAALLKLWPVGKFPVLRDDATDSTIPESSIIIEYLDNRYPGRTRFIPADPRLALRTRLRDRFYDLYVHLSVQKIVGDRLRPQGSRDPHGVEEARARIQSCYGMIDEEATSASPIARRRRRCSMPTRWCRSAAPTRISRLISIASRRGLASRA